MNLVALIFPGIVPVSFVPSGRSFPGPDGIQPELFQMPIFERCIHVALIAVGIGVPSLYFGSLIPILLMLVR